jgi:hypothetical protein
MPDMIDKLLQRRKLIREDIRGASKEYVDEMPHIKIGKDQYFDLELEKGSSSYKKIVLALSGKPVKDKHGNLLHLKTPEDREKFVDLVKANSIFQKATDTTKRMILGQEAENKTSKNKEYESLAAHRPNLGKWKQDMGMETTKD